MGTKIPCLTTWRRLNINGAPHWTRTSDPLFRRQLLFPAELTEHMERMTGVEPAISEWKSEVLPLHYIRIYPPLQVADDCFDYQDDFLNMQAGRHLTALTAEPLPTTLPERLTHLTYGYLLSSEYGVQSHM